MENSNMCRGYLSIQKNKIKNRKKKNVHQYFPKNVIFTPNNKQYINMVQFSNVSQKKWNLCGGKMERGQRKGVKKTSELDREGMHL